MFGFGPKVPQISAEEVKRLLENDKTVAILDVRTPSEVSRGKIERSINVPLDQIDLLEEKMPDKKTKIIVYCLSGSRSAAAVEQMTKMGYTDAVSLTSGLLAWRANGYPLI